MTTLKTNRSECAEIVMRLWPHLDGALPEQERTRVIAHLQGCSACRSHYDFAQAFLAAVRHAAPSLDQFAMLRQRVQSAIAAELAG